MTSQRIEEVEKPVVSILSLSVSLPGCRSLKEKRGRLAVIMNRLHKEFNLSVAEVGLQDSWQSALVGCALISNDQRFNQQLLARVVTFIGNHFPDEPLLDHKVESV